LIVTVVGFVQLTLALALVVSLPKESILKVDKDCHIDSLLEHEYIRDALAILSRHGICVVKIEATRTYHGRHYYFHLAEPVGASTANRLQYLLGDDSKRVDYNRARINSRLVGWNKLFEIVGRRMRTIYSNPALQSTRKHRAGKQQQKARQPDPFISHSGASAH
jgi:hypothetical protein